MSAGDGAAIGAGFVADLLVGDPQHLHPVAGFGRTASRLEQVLYAPNRLRGAVYTALLVGGSAAAAHAVFGRRRRRLGLALLTWTALGGRSLAVSALEVSALVDAGDLEAARRELPRLVGRDPAALDAAGMRRALVESVAENTSDAVVGTLFWAAVGGPAGVTAFRAANTLDAMVGHRSPRHEQFGWAAARLDDLLCWPAARLTALLACLCSPLVGGSPRSVWAIVRRDGGAHPSPNAGRAEAAFAGALGVRLGGTLSYAGRVEDRPTLGDGEPPAAGDVERAVLLSRAVGILSLIVCVLWSRAR